MNDDLYEAVYKNNIQLVKDLLQKGANPDVYKYDIWNALMAASKWGYTKCVQLLLHAGASIYLRHKYGYNALWYASYNGHTKVIKILKRMIVVQLLYDY